MSARFSAGALSLGRLLVSSVLLGVFVFLRPRRWLTKGDWKFLVLCGVLWFGVYNLALNEAEQRLDAGTTAMLVNIGPLLIALLAGFCCTRASRVSSCSAASPRSAG